jgi:hypothetical protein
MSNFTKSTVFLSLTLFVSSVSWAKNSGAAINIAAGKGDSLWNYLPWIWTIGGAIFILFLVAMIRTRQKKYS